MILYHGTNIHFNDIDLQKSNNNKDFGKGFYLSEDLKQAEVILFNIFLQWKRQFLN